jgi:uncharacterized membrane protein (DUF2068 family)
LYDGAVSASGPAKKRLGLRIIAVGKLLKTVTLLVTGVLALALRGGSPPDALLRVARVFRIDEGRHLHRAIESLSGVSSRQLEEIGLATFVYAALFGTEGIGLWLEKKWAEYFTLVITTSFIPLEIYEIVRRPAPLRVVVLVLNVAVLVYLVVQLRRQAAES